MRKKLVDTSAKMKGDAAVAKANQDLFKKEMDMTKKDYERQLKRSAGNAASKSEGGSQEKSNEKSVASKNKQ